MERARVDSSFLRTHRTWEDWAGIALSIMIILSPWMARQSGDPGVVLITALLGLILLTLAQYELVKAHRGVELVELACGLVVTALPVLLGYAGAGQLRTWHFVLGGLVTSLALLELWQGWHSKSTMQTVQSPPLQAKSTPNQTDTMHADSH